MIIIEMILAQTTPVIGQYVAVIFVPGYYISAALGIRMDDSGIVLAFLMDWALYSATIFPLFWFIARQRREISNSPLPGERTPGNAPD
jgi:hypothetical protein